jgi:hypothetical protein
MATSQCCHEDERMVGVRRANVTSRSFIQSFVRHVAFEPLLCQALFVSQQ